jgi:hypothetical protein
MKEDKNLLRLMGNLSYYRDGNEYTGEIIKKFIGLWSNFGNKRYLGKKGKLLLSENLKETYVIMGISSDKISDLKEIIKRLENSTQDMDKVKLIRAKDSMNSEIIKFNQLQERYKFMSLLKSINDLMSEKESKFMKNLDKTLKNKKVLSLYRSSVKEAITDHNQIMDEIDKMDLYFQTLSDTNSVEDNKGNKIIENNKDQDNDAIKRKVQDAEDRDRDVIT